MVSSITKGTFHHIQNITNTIHVSITMCSLYHSELLKSWAITWFPLKHILLVYCTKQKNFIICIQYMYDIKIARSSPSSYMRITCEESRLCYYTLEPQHSRVFMHPFNIVNHNEVDCISLISIGTSTICFVVVYEISSYAYMLCLYYI